jgi:hypothetical protein
MKTEELSYQEAIELASAGAMVSRKDWKNSWFVFRQVNNIVHKDMIPNMRSLPMNVKERLGTVGKSLFYENQLMIADTSGERVVITHFEPEWKDEYYNDWCVL